VLEKRGGSLGNTTQQKKKGEDITMKKCLLTLSALSILALSTATTLACHLKGKVACPNNIVAAGVTINVVLVGGGFTGSGVTDAEGNYAIELPDVGSYKATLDESTLPEGAELKGDNEVNFAIRVNPSDAFVDWVIGGPFCGTGCWLTGGGAMIDPLLGIPVATQGGSKVKPLHSFGGNVYPGCSPTAGDGGNWNHVARGSIKLHFQGREIQVVTCGNVGEDIIPDGSTSPVTPFNYIEFKGTGRLNGIAGNHLKDLGPVTFYARCEDHNEPGSRGAKAGALIDRYYLQVKDTAGNVVLQVGTGDPATDTTESTIETEAITDGNLQLHISSCDNPPTL
jgi:hypothetical protein